MFILNLKKYINNIIKDDQYKFQLYYTSIPTGVLCHEILHVYHVIKINLKICYLPNQCYPLFITVNLILSF